MSRKFGEVRLFLAAIGLFMLASLLCGVARSMSLLVVFRALQGFVAGPLYPITQTLLISIYSSAKRGMALSLLGMVTVVAPIAGPILGGWITDSYSWPWIFFINLPIGLFACLVVFQQLRKRPVQLKQSPMDYTGLLLLVIGVGALQIVLDKGNDLDWFESGFIIAGSALALVALSAFVIWELTDQSPVVNLRLFAYRNFTVGTLVMVVGYAGFFSINLLLPQWLQTQMGYTATWAGLAAAPIGLFPMLLSPFVGRYAQNFDLRVLASLAFMVMVTTSFMRSQFTSDIDYPHIAVVQLIMGLGVAFFMMPVLSILLSELPADEIADGSGLATFLRTVAGSFAASLTTWLWNRRATIHHAHLSESISLYASSTREALTQLGGASNPQSLRLLDGMLLNQAYMLSTVEIFALLGWVFLAILMLIWMARPPFAMRSRDAAVDH